MILGGLLGEDVHGRRQMAVDDEYVDPMSAVDDEVKDRMSILQVASSMNLVEGGGEQEECMLCC